MKVIYYNGGRLHPLILFNAESKSLNLIKSFKYLKQTKCYLPFTYQGKVKELFPKKIGESQKYDRGEGAFAVWLKMKLQFLIISEHVEILLLV